jgi:hypothetical protein
VRSRVGGGGPETPSYPTTRPSAIDATATKQGLARGRATPTTTPGNPPVQAPQTPTPGVAGPLLPRDNSHSDKELRAPQSGTRGYRGYRGAQTAVLREQMVGPGWERDVPLPEEEAGEPAREEA